MSDHAVAVAVWTLHRAPRVILGRRLNIPNITSVSSNVTRLERSRDVFGDAQSATSGVHNPGALLQVANRLLVDDTLGGGMKGAVDGQNVELEGKQGKSQSQCTFKAAVDQVPSKFNSLDQGTL